MLNLLSNEAGPGSQVWALGAIGRLTASRTYTRPLHFVLPFFIFFYFSVNLLLSLNALKYCSISCQTAGAFTAMINAGLEIALLDVTTSRAALIQSAINILNGPGDIRSKFQRVEQEVRPILAKESEK